jgi:hypothetical protein
LILSSHKSDKIKLPCIPSVKEKTHKIIVDAIQIKFKITKITVKAVSIFCMFFPKILSQNIMYLDNN